MSPEALKAQRDEDLSKRLLKIIFDENGEGMTLEEGNEDLKSLEPDTENGEEYNEDNYDVRTF